MEFPYICRRADEGVCMKKPAWGRILLFLGVVLATFAAGPVFSKGLERVGEGTPVPVDGGSYLNISPATLNAFLLKKDFYFVNVHIPYEGEIALTDAFIPFDQTRASLDRYPTDKSAKIVLYCRSGRMSDIAARELVRQGYTRVFNLEGGMIQWEKSGLPLKRLPGKS
jgi:rhodanese-related sulfurtransferase